MSGFRYPISDSVAWGLNDQDEVSPEDKAAALQINQWAVEDAISSASGLWITGDLKMSARATPSTGWLLCDGRAVSRSTYSSLYAAISTTYGAGDTTSTFNLPDFKGRVMVGAGTGSGLTARTRGTPGGTETHQLVTGEMPAHTHGTGETIFGAGLIQFAGGGGQGILGVTDSTGGGGAHANMQPFTVANVFIKI